LRRTGLGRLDEPVPGRSAGAYGSGGTAARACSPSGAFTWCTPEVSGAAFNPAWDTFESW